MAVAAEAPGQRPSASLTVLVASTPGAGSWRLGKLLGSTGAIPAPITCFNPFSVPSLSRKWAVARGTDEWPARYLNRALSAATHEGVCCVSLMWLHARWLMRIARASLASTDDIDSLSDADVISAWFPRARYLHLRSADTARQALRWYAARHPRLPSRRSGAPIPDYQEVRWLETIVVRQSRSWQAFFDIHGIDPQVIEYNDLRTRQSETAGAILTSLGLAASPRKFSDDLPDGPIDRRAEAWLEPYRQARPRLSTVVGVRSARP